MLRTFSKAMAFAALRIGYLLASPDLVREIGKAVLPYNVNVFSQVAAEVAIENYESELRPLVQRDRLRARRLFAELSQIDGLRAGGFGSEFHPREISHRIRNESFAELLARDILIRDVSGYPMLSDYFRFSVGTPEENDYVVESNP